MNKHAFTLIELLGVIIILGIIGMIVTPIVQNAIGDSDKKLCEYQYELYKKAAKGYVDSNPYKAKSSITLQELVDKGYLESSQVKCGSLDDVIEISYSNGGYTFEYYGSD